MGGGKGSSAPTNSTVNQTNLPEYARPYYEHMLNAAEQEVNQPYVPYSGQRVAAATPFMNQYYTGISNMGPAYPVLEGQDMTRTAAQNAASRTGYQAGTIENQYGPSTYNTTGPEFSGVQSGIAGWNNWGSGVANQYMSPYQQYVTDLQKQAAVVDYGRQRNARNDAAFKANAFGGDRQAVMEALGEESLMNRLNSIQGSGLQSAYENAQQQFERDRSAGLQGQQFNIGSDLQAQMANQQQGLNYWNAGQAAKQFGANFNDQSLQAFNKFQMDAAAQNEQNRQAAESLGLNWNNQAMAGGQQLGGLAELFQNLESQRLGQIGQAGQLQQSQAQTALDTSYEDFINQRDYGRNNIAFISSILHGLPTGVNTQSSTIAYQNPVANALGAGIGAIGLSRAAG